MARNGKRNTKSNGKRTATRRPSQRRIGTVALAVAGLVALAGAGHALTAVLGAVALYVLVTGRVAASATMLPSARQVLRGLCWGAVAAAVAMSAQGPTQVGGATLGLALAAALATALRLTRK